MMPTQFGSGFVNMDMKTHLRAGLWSGIFTGLLVGFIESTFLLFNTGSFLANFPFFIRASLLYALAGAVGGMALAVLLKNSLLRTPSQGEEPILSLPADKLKSFYVSILLPFSLFVGIGAYLLDIVFPLLSRNFSTFFYLALTGLFSIILGVGLFKFFPLSKLGSERSWFIPVSFMVLAVVYQGMLLGAERGELRGYTSRKSPAPPPKPNVLLIVMDTTRADHFSSYGYRKPTTPHIDKLAKEGRLFTNAIAPSSWTIPSHASLFTGVYSSKHGMGYLNSYLSEDLPTLAEILSKNGYRSLSIYNNPFAGEMVGLSRGFDKAIGVDLDHRTSLTIERLFQRLVYNDVGSNARETVDAASNWIATTAKTGLPYFAFVHFNDPHTPYRAREPYFTEFKKDINLNQVDLSKVAQVNAHRRSFHKYLNGEVQLSSADFEYLKALYDSEIRSVDEQIGRLMDSLKEKGFLKNTLVIVTADHGEYIGEHQWMSHQFLYNTVLRIPMVFWYPEQIPPGIETRYVSLVDILPTVLSVAGLKDQIPVHTQGMNLLPEGSQGINLVSLTGPRTVFSEWWSWVPADTDQSSPNKSKALLKFTKEAAKDIATKAIFDGDWKFIWLSNGKHELYNLANDPEEQRNLIEAEPEKAQELQAKLEQWLGSFQQARVTSGSGKKEFKDMLKSLGYVQ